MGKIVSYTPDPNNPAQLTPEQEARQDALLEKGGPEYYEDFPPLSQEFLDNAQWVDYHQQAKEPVAVEIAPKAAAYLRSRGPAFQSRIGAMIEAQIAEAQASEQRT